MYTNIHAVKHTLLHKYRQTYPSYTPIHAYIYHKPTYTSPHIHIYNQPHKYTHKEARTHIHSYPNNQTHIRYTLTGISQTQYKLLLDNSMEEQYHILQDIYCLYKQQVLSIALYQMISLQLNPVQYTWIHALVEFLYYPRSPFDLDISIIVYYGLSFLSYIMIAHYKYSTKFNNMRYLVDNIYANYN